MEDKKEVFTGSVIFFSNAYGFIEWEKDGVKQNDVFVHWTDIDVPSGYKTLKKGQAVSFELGTNHKSQPKAVLVKILEVKK